MIRTNLDAGPVIPLLAGETAVFHVEAQFGAPKFIAGPAWENGPAGGPGVSPVVTLFGGRARAAGLTNWTTRKYLRLGAPPNVATQAYLALGWAFTFVIALPTYDSPSGNYGADAYVCDLSMMANQGGAFFYVPSGSSDPKNVKMNAYYAGGYSTHSISPGLALGSGVHVVSIGINANNTASYTKVDANAAASGTALSGVNMNASTRRTYLGTWGAYPEDQPAVDQVMTTWSSGIIYAARMVAVAGGCSAAHLDNLHAKIMV